MNTPLNLSSIKVIIGLGNPGRKFYNNRHNIGFRVVEELSKQFGGSFKKIDEMELAQVNIYDNSYYLVMPQTFMNSSGKILSYFTKKGISAENILVIHDELELPYGKVKFKMGGSHKGHNGLKSIIQQIGPDFARLALGIGRPQNREEVPNYVLEDFKDPVATQTMIDEALAMIENSVFK